MRDTARQGHRPWRGLLNRGPDIAPSAAAFTHANVWEQESRFL